MIDDCRLWGSRRCRRGGVRLTNVGSDTWAGHDFNYHNASLSEGGFPAIVVGDFSETQHWTRDNTDFPHPLRKSEAKLCLACPCGKAFRMKTWRQIILVNLALTTVGLRVWLDPWPAPGEVALLDLVRETEPLGLFTPRARNSLPTVGPSRHTSRPSGHAGARTSPSRHGQA